MYEIDDNNTDNPPWLVVGQGLAGSVLGLELWRRGVPFVIADADMPHAASAAAAGLYNPVTGKRMQLTWQADVLWPVLEQFYPWAEALLGVTFFYPLPNVRPLFTAAEQADAEKRAAAGPLAPWLTVTDTLPWEPESQVRAPFGALLVPRAGYVDVAAFCQAARSWFVGQGLFIAQKLVQENIETEEGGVYALGKPYKGVIWATGAFLAEHAGLAALPLAPLKGEILRVKPELQEREFVAQAYNGVLNRAAYLTPRADGTLWAGSTYEHAYETAEPTLAGKESILERVSRFYTPSLAVLEHKAGIRPSVTDRRPLLGPLPGFEHQFVFTGMGTKGVSLAPWCATVLCDYLVEGSPIPPEVAVRLLANVHAKE
jgi:glycine/D-amino acid oxidase-like deaminating enzyme